MKLKSTLAIVVMAAVPGLALAQTTSTPRIDKRQELQQKRIDKGVQSGALNEKEAARLEKGQERVEKMEEKAAADGKVTVKERARIEHRQDQQSKKIFRQKHDQQRAQ
jgi:hypothetical protein